MKKIAVAEITDGLVLARPVTDGSGRELLARGLSLQVQHADLLARRGIEFVMIEAEDASTSGAGGGSTEAEDIAPVDGRNASPVSPAAKEALEALAHAFEPVLDDPDMQKLYELACDCARRRA